MSAVRAPNRSRREIYDDLSRWRASHTLPGLRWVTADYRSRLQASLGPAYTLERELGGGGMSTVFLAEETAPPQAEWRRSFSRQAVSERSSKAEPISFARRTPRS